jgi:hypothetical protein
MIKIIVEIVDCSRVNGCLSIVIIINQALTHCKTVQKRLKIIMYHEVDIKNQNQKKCIAQLKALHKNELTKTKQDEKKEENRLVKETVKRLSDGKKNQKGKEPIFKELLQRICFLKKTNNVLITLWFKSTQSIK